MFVFALVAIYAAACWKWGAWRRWKEFYPTILYMIISNLNFAYVFYEYRPWIFNSFAGDTMMCIVIKDLIYPTAVILFLTHYPESKIKQLLYIAGWAAANTLLEGIAHLLGGIYYEHGWNLLWSFALLFLMFALVRLHYKRPLFVWIPSILCAVAMALILKLPYPR